MENDYEARLAMSERALKFLEKIKALAEEEKKARGNEGIRNDVEA